MFSVLHRCCKSDAFTTQHGMKKKNLLRFWTHFIDSYVHSAFVMKTNFYFLHFVGMTYLEFMSTNSMHQNILLRLVWFHKTHAPFSIFNAKTKTYVVHFPHQYHRSKALITFMNIEKYLFFLRNGKFHGKPAILQIFGATLHSFINFFTLQVAQVVKFHGIAWACAVRVVNLVYKMQTFLLFFSMNNENLLTESIIFIWRIVHIRKLLLFFQQKIFPTMQNFYLKANIEYFICKFWCLQQQQ